MDKSTIAKAEINVENAIDVGSFQFHSLGTLVPSGALDRTRGSERQIAGIYVKPAVATVCHW